LGVGGVVSMVLFDASQNPTRIYETSKKFAIPRRFLLISKLKILLLPNAQQTLHGRCKEFLKMKNLLLFIFVLIVNISFSQNKNKVFSRKELINNSEAIDTTTYIEYYSNKNIKSKRIVEKQSLNIKGEPNFIECYIKVEKYRKNGHLKEEHYYNKWLTIKMIYYDTKGRKSDEYNMIHLNPEEKKLYSGKYYYTGETSNSYQRLTYKNGNLILLAGFLEGKKNGIWEYYNVDNKLTKKVEWKSGKKIKVEKL
jgi:hypothetical protein